MKNYLFVVLMLCSTVIFAQSRGAVDIYLKVVNSVNEPVANMPLSLTNVNTHRMQENFTDAQGKVQFLGERGVKYSLSFNDYPDYLTIDVPVRSMGYLVKTITYDPPSNAKRKDQLPPDTVYQSNKVNISPGPLESIVDIPVIDSDNRPVRRLPVRMYCPEINKIYIDETDGSGKATFIVPFGKKYEVGIAEIDKYSIFSLPNKPVRYNRKLRYQTTNIKENIANDTITQEFVDSPKPTSARALVHLRITDLQKAPLNEEKVFFNKSGSSIVYMALTNSNGEAWVLLPKGDKYVLNLKYERDIDEFNYPLRDGYSTSEVEFNYMGTKNIEEHYANTKRNMQGFLTEFLESKAERIGFDPSMIEKTDNGFNINFQRDNISSPTFAEGNVYVGGGYYTNDFYSFDATNGAFQWGLKLSDNGPSSAVYYDGVIVMITQSCTMYGIDALAGRLLWSKWLGPNMYSTPTVADGKVFAVYPDEVRDYIQKNRDPFVMAAFDLKTGEIVWQNRIDSEVLASPVFDNKSVYLTSMAGSVYLFDKDNGEIKSKLIKVGAVAPPTVVNDKLYVNIRQKNDSTMQDIWLYQSNSLKPIKRLDKLSGKAHYKTANSLSAISLMSFDGSRITHYKGNNYNIVGGNLLCSNPQTGAIIWKKFLSTPVEREGYEAPVAGMPVVAGNKILVSLSNGEIKIFNAQTGALFKSYNTKASLFSQPIVNDGWIYNASNGGKMVSINTGIKELSGWSMWSFNAAHNPVIK